MKNAVILRDAWKAWSILSFDFKARSLWLVLGMFIVVSLEGLGIGLLYGYLNLLAGDLNSLADLPKWLHGYQSLFFGMERVELIEWGSLILAVFFISKNIIAGLFSYFQNRFIFTRLYQASANLFQNYIRGDYLAMEARNSAEIVRNLTENIFGLYANVVLSALNIAMECITIAILVSAIIVVDPLGALTAGFLMISLVTLYQMLMSHRFLAWGNALNDRAERMLRFIYETLGALKEIKVLGREEFFENRMRANANELARLRVLSALSGFLPRLYVETALVTVVLGLAVIMVRRTVGVETPLATLGLFGAVAFRMMPSANRLLSNLGVLRSASASIDVLYRDRTNAERPRNSCGEIVGIKGFNSLTLENVSFTYVGRGRPAIENVSLTVCRGRSLAIVGRSGAGKTTLADVLLGLLQPQSGRILADGREIDASVLARRVAYVPQTPYFLDDTLRRNVAFAESDDRIDESRVEAALKAAELCDLALHLEHGLDARLGENANRLSGGQRQRVALARAFYQYADLLVLDEATSALDMETEAEVSRAVGNLARDRALLVIAHRLSTIQHCDVIILMDKGRIIASGDFPSLCESSEDFRRLVKLGQLNTERAQTSGQG